MLDDAEGLGRAGRPGRHLPRNDRARPRRRKIQPCAEDSLHPRGRHDAECERTGRNRTDRAVPQHDLPRPPGGRERRRAELSRSAQLHDGLRPAADGDDEPGRQPRSERRRRHVDDQSERHPDHRLVRILGRQRPQLEGRSLRGQPELPGPALVRNVRRRRLLQQTALRQHARSRSTGRSTNRTSTATSGSTRIPLEPNTNYIVRIHAQNAGGASTSPALPFKTKSLPPVVQTLNGTGGPNSAQLSAKINPKNAPVTYQFEWGVKEGEDDETYENLDPIPGEGLPLADNAMHLVSTTIEGLEPETTYHFRVVATNTQTSEVSRGADRTFTTSGAPPGPKSCPNESSRVGPSAKLPDCRAFEFVTPKMNQSRDHRPGPGSPTARVAPDGNHVTFNPIDAPVKAEGARLDRKGDRQQGARRVARRRIALSAAARNDRRIHRAAARRDRRLPRLHRNDRRSRPADRPERNRLRALGLYLHKADDTFVPITHKNGGQFSYYEVSVASQDYTHIFFLAGVPQVEGDPLHGYRTAAMSTNGTTASSSWSGSCRRGSGAGGSDDPTDEGRAEQDDHARRQQGALHRQRHRAPLPPGGRRRNDRRLEAAALDAESERNHRPHGGRDHLGRVRSLLRKQLGADRRRQHRRTRGRSQPGEQPLPLQRQHRRAHRPDRQRQPRRREAWRRRPPGDPGLRSTSPTSTSSPPATSLPAGPPEPRTSTSGTTGRSSTSGSTRSAPRNPPTRSMPPRTAST